MKKLKVRDCYLFDLETINDNQTAFLSIAQSKRDLPFDIKRVFFIYGIKNNSRGNHAHRQLKQIIFCLQGSFDLWLDDGYNKEKIRLNNPQQAVFISNLIWKKMENFSKDCKILVLASEEYNEKDYIRDYQEFRSTVHSLFSDTASK